MRVGRYVTINENPPVFAWLAARPALFYACKQTFNMARRATQRKRIGGQGEEWRGVAFCKRNIRGGYIRELVCPARTVQSVEGVDTD